jgi:hypothetical protein
MSNGGAKSRHSHAARDGKGVSWSQSARRFPGGPSGNPVWVRALLRRPLHSDRLVLLSGEKEAWTPLPWQALEKVLLSCAGEAGS